MPEKLFRIMDTNDGLREAFLEEHGGRLPDNFVESEMGGAINAPPNPDAERADLAMEGALDSELRELVGKRLPDGPLQYDWPADESSSDS